MAKTELADGQDLDAKALAQRIITAQNAEITRSRDHRDGDSPQRVTPQQSQISKAQLRAARMPVSVPFG